MRKIFLLFAVLLGVSVLFVSCKGSSGDEKNSEPIEEAEFHLSLVEDGVPKFEIVCSYEATKNEKNAAVLLKNNINDAFDCDLTVGDDYNEADKFNQVPIATETLEILVGDVNRVECESVFAKLETQYDWCVAIVNNKIVLAAKNDENLIRAVEYLTKLIPKDARSWTISTNSEYYFLSSENQLIQKLATEYYIIYAKDSTNRTKQVAHDLADMIENLSTSEDKWVEVGADTRKEKDYEILIGETNRIESQAENVLGYYDYDILVRGNKILLRAGNSFTMECAADVLKEMIVYNELHDVQYRFDESLLNPYAYDPDSFVPSWSAERSVPEWMTDFDEKLYAITNPSGRLMSVSHRADMVNYPENSLEGIISAIKLGADVLELDLWLTKDNVLIVLHDDTLKRTTNVASMKGKNGLPDSVKPGDWTYAELQQLSLLDRNGNVTPYKIPTFYETLMVARDHCFIAIDQKESTYKAEDILEIETALDALEVSIYAMFLSGSTGGGPAQGDSWSYMTNYSKQHPELTKFAAYIEKLNAYMKMPGHSIRTRGWVNGAASDKPELDSYAAYEKAYEENRITLMYCNNIPLMSKYIAENFTPDLSSSNN